MAKIDPLSSYFDFSKGINKISSTQEDRIEHLPKKYGISPSDLRIEDAVKTIYPANNFDSEILKSLQPRIKDESILVSRNFYVMPIEIMDDLKKGELSKVLDKDLLNTLEDTLGEELINNEIYQEGRNALIGI